MTCKEAIQIIKKMIVNYAFPANESDALKMAVTALMLQDGNLYLRDVPGSLSIGIVQGTVYMGGYEDGE